MDRLPMVSIIIPVYNGSDYVEEAIAGALTQTWPRCEVIVVNDGSNDGGRTHRAVMAYGSAIRYFQKENGGVASALNYGLEKMNGEYFSWLSHDDAYLPDKIAAQMAILESEQSEAILYGNYEHMDAHGAFLGPVRVQAPPPDGFRLALLQRLIAGKPFLNGCTMLIPKKVLVDAGGFNEDLKTIQDYDLWFRLSANHEFRHMPQILIRSRIHPRQGSMVMEETGAERAELIINAADTLAVEETESGRCPTLTTFYLDRARELAQHGPGPALDHMLYRARQFLNKDQEPIRRRNARRLNNFRFPALLLRLKYLLGHALSLSELKQFRSRHENWRSLMKNALVLLKGRNG